MINNFYRFFVCFFFVRFFCSFFFSLSSTLFSCGCRYNASGLSDWIKLIKTKNVLNIEGIPVGYYIVADGIYTLQPGIMTPHEPKFRPLSWAQKQFDFWQSSTRMVIEQTFGILKGRWCILDSMAKLNYKPKPAADIFTACCVLHNWCLLHSDVWPRHKHLPAGFHKHYENVNPAGQMATGNTAEPRKMGEAQRNALMVALLEAHSHN